MYSNVNVRYALILSDFNATWICISKSTQISNLIKIHPVGAELLHAGGHGEANSRYSPFCEHAHMYKELCSRVNYTTVCNDT
jgi:hypothetical protein